MSGFTGFRPSEPIRNESQDVYKPQLGLLRFSAPERSRGQGEKSRKRYAGRRWKSVLRFQGRFFSLFK